MNRVKLHFKTYGCRANSLDTDALHEEALRRGFEIVGDNEKADAYVINSCTVTHQADRDARLQAMRVKRENPLSLVAVIGCYAQVGKEELLKMPEVDLVVGTANKFEILGHLENAMNSGDWERDRVEPAVGFLPEDFMGSRLSRANIKIQDGCNFNCSFCIIPKARGRSRSLPIATILKQIDQAAALGFEEIVLTGIHIAHYGWDLETDLMQLLREIFKSASGPRVRLSTLDPFEIPDEMIAWLGTNERFCPHFHVAIQSGSDSVLAAMRRIYKASEFTDVTAKIEKQYADTFIGVDVIVGFPGETDRHFQETVECLQDSFWSKLHVFPFSVRAGTRAELIEPKVSPSVIHDRVQILLRMSEARHERFLQSQLGKRRKVILEKPSAKQPGLWLGHTENYLPTASYVEAGKVKQASSQWVQQIKNGKLYTSVTPLSSPDLIPVPR